MVAQTVRVERQRDLGVERTREIPLDDHGAEAFLPPRLDLRPVLFTPIEFKRVIGFLAFLGILVRPSAPPLPGDCDASFRRRKRSEFRGIRRQFVQREPEILRRLRLERDIVAGNRHPCLARSCRSK